MFRGSTFDLIAVVLVAIVLLFPRPGVRVLPGLDRASAMQINRVSELEVRYVSAEEGSPAQLAIALELADLYMALGHPDWALAVLRPLESSHKGEAKLFLAIAVAFAERFDFPLAKSSLDRVRLLCKEGKCSAGEDGRSELLASAIGEVVAQGASFVKNPNQVREILDKALHSTKIPSRKPDGSSTFRSANGNNGNTVRPCTSCHPKMFFSK